MTARRRGRGGPDGRDGREGAHAGTGHERWLMSYADLVTLLLALFTALYAISRVDRSKAAVASRSVADALRRSHEGARPASPSPPSTNTPAAIVATAEGGGASVVALDFDAAVQRAVEGTSLRGRVSVRAHGDGVAISVDDAALFASGSAELGGDAEAGLAALGRALAERPFERIVVEGHTDAQPVKGGRYRSNLQLSTARAERVVDLLARAAGIPSERLVASGYGEHQPVASNETPEGRAKNRRVDLVVRVPQKRSSHE